MTKISANFAVEEFGQHAGYGCKAEAYPEKLVTDGTLPRLCAALEVVRAHFGRPVRVTSGFRSRAYNDAMYRGRGEKPTRSQHSEGTAADITVDGVPAPTVHAAILDLDKRGLIAIGALGAYPTFTHVDVRPRADDGHLARWSGYGS